MKLDLNRNVTTPQGIDVEPNLTLAFALSNVLSQDSKGDALKVWEWSKKLATVGILDIDTSDTDTLKTMIKESERMTILLKGQLLLEIKAAEAK